jgi:AcrR family transcriptional regulator
MRTRLSTEQRRAQLLAIGAGLFAQRPYEEVSIEEVAEIASVSCGLLYHYFPSKRAFFRAIVADESAKLLQASTPDPTLPQREQLNAALDVYIDYAESNPGNFRVAQQAAATDSALRDIHQARVNVHTDHILTALTRVMTVDAETQIAVTGWLAFVPTAILGWLNDPVISREQLRDVCARALWAAVGLQVPGDALPRERR